MPEWRMFREPLKEECLINTLIDMEFVELAIDQNDIEAIDQNDEFAYALKEGVESI